MKTILTTFLTVAVSTFAVAQNPDKALSRVSYTFVHVQDTTQKDKPYTENMLLVIGKNASVYTSYDKINNMVIMNKQIQEQIKNNVGGSQRIISRGPSKPVSQLDYFYFAKENKFITKDRVFNSYLIEEEAPKINWKLSKDTASFSGVKCKKATANFKGRNWIAWYAPELPFQSGPWKLNGLPGLIIEAYDEKKEVQFQFAGMETVPADAQKEVESSAPQLSTPSGGVVRLMAADTGASYLGAEIKVPADAIKTTKKELEKLKEARDKDPQGFMNAQLASSGVKLNGPISFQSAGPGAVKKNPINNPIELSDN